MITQRDDDYLICREYQERIDQVSSEYPGFITFRHPNQNYYFAWVNGKDIIMRSEAYPDEERMIRGIKAIIKNRDIIGRYSVEEAHGVSFLLLWGGGDHQVHTGNMESHNEIGRSCPKKSREELHAMLLFMGKDFADAVVPLSRATDGLATAAAAAATAVAAAATSTSAKIEPPVAPVAASEGGGFNWKWLLPLLLLIPIFFWWKSCNGKKAGSDPDLSGATTMVTDTMPKIADAKDTTTLAATPPPAVPDCNLNWIFFAYDKYDITAEAQEELTTLANILKGNAEYTAELKAYTDAKGTDEYNSNLSANRANAAKSALTNMGIDAARILTSANSEANPIAVNTDDDRGRHFNRRVELRVKDKSGKEVCKSIPPSIPSNLKN